MTYLLPLRILKGHLPTDELLQRFPVLKELFTPFISAIRAGDIASFDSALEKWEHRLLELNLWLTIERARELCIRGLFRRVYVHHHYAVVWVDALKPHLLKLGGCRQGITHFDLDVPCIPTYIRRGRSSRGSRVLRREHDIQRAYEGVYQS